MLSPERSRQEQADRREDKPPGEGVASGVEGRGEGRAGAGRRQGCDGVAGSTRKGLSVSSLLPSSLPTVVWSSVLTVAKQTVKASLVSFTVLYCLSVHICNIWDSSHCAGTYDRAVLGGMRERKGLHQRSQSGERIGIQSLVREIIIPLFLFYC